MAGIVLEAVGLGKRYRIGGGPPPKLKEAISRAFTAPFRWAAPRATEWLWAIRDVSFEVREGEVLGIVGRNGSGKSTLLRLLARITEPTAGHALVRGRIGALLEVGTGFHPDLTGRENIFMNGALLGMRRREILRRLDEIVAFAEVERFLDTPMKHYSNGMYVRLGFAVAAHLEPDVLLADEVLAVGDFLFQRKCLGKIGEVARSGRTVLLVSHDMAAVHALCSRAIWLERGAVQGEGSASDVVRTYLASGAQTSGEATWPAVSGPGTDEIRLTAVRILGRDGRLTGTMDVKDSFRVELSYRLLAPMTSLRVWFRLLSADGVVVFTAGDNAEKTWLGRVREPGDYASTCTIPGELLQAGTYFISVGAAVLGVRPLFELERAVRLDLEQASVTGAMAHGGDRLLGVINPTLEWTIARREPAAS